MRLCLCGCGRSLEPTTKSDCVYLMGHNPDAVRHRGEKHKAYRRKWLKDNPDKRLAHVLKAKFGMSVEQYHSMRIAQNDQCAICKTTKFGGNFQRWAVDHCHSTGKIRGLLCNSCNSGIGHLGDTAAGLRAALQYLEKSEGVL